MVTGFFRYLLPVVRRFWDICLLRKGPEDVPASLPLLLLLIPPAVLLDFVGVSLVVQEVGGGRLLGILLLSSAVLLGLVTLVLMLLGYTRRILQTLLALLGTGIIFSTAVLPFVYVAALHPGEPTLAALAILALQIWVLVVTGHILSRALVVSLVLGVLLALGYTMLGYSVFNLLLGGE